jgi:branched-chain amino acid transport system permease protein
VLGQLFLSGLATGSLYALTAVAVVVVFRNTRTINLAQGDFAMMGAFFAVILLKSFALSYLATLVITVVCVMALGVLTERLVMRPIA